MATLLEELEHRQVVRRIRPLSKEASTAGVGMVVGVLLMVLICLAIRMA